MSISRQVEHDFAGSVSIGSAIGAWIMGNVLIVVLYLITAWLYFIILDAAK